MGGFGVLESSFRHMEIALSRKMRIYHMYLQASKTEHASGSSCNSPHKVWNNLPAIYFRWFHGNSFLGKSLIQCIQRLKGVFLFTLRNRSSSKSIPRVVEVPSCLVEFCKWVQLRKVPPRCNSPTSYTFDLPKSTWRETTTQSLMALIIFVPIQETKKKYQLNLQKSKKSNWNLLPGSPTSIFHLLVQWTTLF